MPIVRHSVKGSAVHYVARPFAFCPIFNVVKGAFNLRTAQQKGMAIGINYLSALNAWHPSRDKSRLRSRRRLSSRTTAKGAARGNYDKCERTQVKQHF